MSFGSRILTLLLAAVCLTAIAHLDGSPEAAGRTSQLDKTSRMTIRDATPSQVIRVGEALRAFEEAGLELPDLEIRFFTDDETCGAEHGRFYPSEDIWRIHICPTEVDAVYEHELAHAWELANVTDAQRREFMQMRGYESWSDRELPWDERGVEGAASVIERGVAGLPLPPVLGREEVSRMRAYELLTGRPAPVLVDWVRAKEVPCVSRPTMLSATVEDASGRTCSVTVSSMLAGQRTPAR